MAWRRDRLCDMMNLGGLYTTRRNMSASLYAARGVGASTEQSRAVASPWQAQEESDVQKTSKDAYLIHEANTIRIGTSRVEKTLQLSEYGGFAMVGYTNKLTGRQYVSLPLAKVYRYDGGTTWS